jgi:hypothetical protein
VSVSNARQLLKVAEQEPQRLKRHLLLAAALREVLSQDPIVVGGTAEEFWTQAEYHETDLDLCARLTPKDRTTLRELRFEHTGRHWKREGLAAVVEFPDDRIDGDESRTVEAVVGSGRCRIIGLDDLYLDRLRQATIDERHEGVEFQSALAVVAARYEDIDRAYVGRCLSQIRQNEGLIGDAMKRIDSRIRRRVRRVLSEPDRDRART